jgi:uncharacterized protein (TIGR02599 family)
MLAKDLQVGGVVATGPGHALFFQAPLGTTGDQRYTPLTNLLNGRGYFIALISDAPFRPKVLDGLGIPERVRYRLMEFLPPTERNQVYAAANEADAGGNNLRDRMKWITVPLTNGTNSGTIRPLAENIVAFVVSPREAVADTGSSTGIKSQQALAAADRDATARVAPNFVYDSAAPVDSDQWPMHTLPPLIKITMVAMDEVSAMRLEERYGPRFMDHFIPNNWMRTAGLAQKDLDSLIQSFDDESQAAGGVKVSYKVFTSTVRINGAKWSVPPSSN